MTGGALYKPPVVQYFSKSAIHNVGAPSSVGGLAS